MDMIPCWFPTMQTLPEFPDKVQMKLLVAKLTAYY